MIKTKISFLALFAVLAACSSNQKITARSSVIHTPEESGGGAEDNFSWTDENFEPDDSPIVETGEKADEPSGHAVGYASGGDEFAGASSLDKDEELTENLPCGYYKIGNPYLIDGVPYYPHEDWKYSETGMASWYGPEFHGGKTSNGETFDQNKFTAAHRTLPMPSLARVTNLENGRAITVKINDRGPFARDRIIDLSSASAEAIGMKQAGSARVKVEILAVESRNLKRLAMKCENSDIYGPDTTQGETPPILMITDDDKKATIIGPIIVSPGGRSEQEAGSDVLVEEMIASEPAIAESTPAVPAPATTRAPAALAPQSFYVQVAAYSTYEKAEALKNKVVRHGDVKIFRATQDGKPIFKVRLGEYATEADARAAKASLDKAGIAGSRVLLNDNGVLRWR